MPQTRNRQLVRGTLGEYLFLTVSLLTAVVRVPVGVRYFGVADFGIWLTVSAIASYASLSRLGFAGSVVTLFARNSAEDERRTILRRSLATTAVIGAVLLAVTIYLYQRHAELVSVLFNADRSRRELAVVVTFLVIGFTMARIPATVFLSAFAGLGEVFWKNVHLAIGSILGLAAFLITTLLGGTLVHLAVAVGVAGLVDGLLTAVHLWKRHPELFAAPEDGFVSSMSLRSLLVVSLTFFALNVFETVIWRTDAIVVSAYLGPVLVTVYGVTFQLYRILLQLVIGINAPAWPLFGQLIEQGEWRQVESTYRDLSLLSVFLGGLAWVGGTVFAGPVIAVWAGGDAFAGLWVSTWIGAIVFVSAFTHANSILVNGLSPTRSVAVASGVEAALNLGLSFALVTRFGLAGIAAATLLARLATAAWFLPRYVRRRTGDKVRLDGRALSAMGLLTLAGVAAALASATMLGRIPGVRFAPLVVGGLVVVVHVILGLRLAPQFRRHLVDLVRGRLTQVSKTERPG